MGHVVSLKKTVTSVSIMITSSKVTMMMATGLPRLRMIPKSAPQKIPNCDRPFLASHQCQTHDNKTKIHDNNQNQSHSEKLS